MGQRIIATPSNRPKWLHMMITRPPVRAAASGLLAVLLAALLAPVDAGATVAVRSCTNADRTASYRATDAGAGHRYGRLILTDASSSRCRTGGYGGLSYVGDGAGTQIGHAATRDPGTVRSYVVRPGQRLV